MRLISIVSFALLAGCQGSLPLIEWPDDEAVEFKIEIVKSRMRDAP